MAAKEPVEMEWDGDVAIIRLNDPVTLNALTFNMLEALLDAIGAAEKTARAVILTGAGKAFCSGANLEQGLDRKHYFPADQDAGEALSSHINPAISRLRALSVPWITAVRGAAAGAGASFALAGDMVIASETARFILAFSRIGLVPDAGINHLLVHAIGRVRANELMLLGGQFSAEQAAAWGLANRVVPDAALEHEAMAVAQALAKGPASLGTTRRMSWSALDDDWHELLAAEAEAQRGAGRSRDFQEGVDAFREKRPAQFKGR